MIHGLTDKKSITAGLFLNGIILLAAMFFFRMQGFAQETRDAIHFLSLPGENSDSILLESNGHYALIDASNPSPDVDDEWDDPTANGQVVSDYLTMLGVKRLDFILATHSHCDHIGGIPDVVSRGFVDSGTVYLYKPYRGAPAHEQIWNNEKYFERALQAMEGAGALMTDVSSGASACEGLFNSGRFETGGSTVTDNLSFLWEDMEIRLYNLYFNNERENLNSIVSVVSCGETAAWLGADIESTHGVETAIARAVADRYGGAEIYKAAHHGSNTSNCYETLKALYPATIIITDGWGDAGQTVDESRNLFAQYAERVLQADTYITSMSLWAVVADITQTPSYHTYDPSGQLWAEPQKARFVYPQNTFLDWKHADGTPYLIYCNDRQPLEGTFTASGGMQYESDADGLCRIILDTSATEPGLRTTGGRSCYILQDGTLARGWVSVGEDRYFFGTFGMNATGWIKSNGKWYFLDGAGRMQTGWIRDDTGSQYYLETTGEAASGWKKLYGKWYYFYNGGRMATGLIRVDGSYFYMDSAGIMQTGWQKIDGSWYLFKPSGVMITGWTRKSGKWYYLKSSGVMATGWTKSNGKWYYLKSSGVMQTGWLKDGGRWYYLKSSGVMTTGWQKVSGTWYYFDSSGRMLSGTSRRIGGKTYVFAGSGACINP